MFRIEGENRAVTIGLSRTMQVLSSTGNEAAVDLLLAALESPRSETRESAVRGLLERRSLRCQRALVQHWHTFDEPIKQIVAERPGRIHNALRDALLGKDPKLCSNACDAVLWVREYDLFPVLLTATEDRANPQADETARTLLALAETLYEEFSSPRDYRIRRDPQLIRQHLLGHLDEAVARYDQHRRVEVLDAFLLLTTRENATLKRVLLNPHDKSFVRLIDVLTTSSRPGIMRLLLAFLDDPHAPHAALSALGHRTDETFRRHLLKKLVEVTPAMKANLKRVESISWLREDPRRLLPLTDDEQAAVITLATASGLKRAAVYEVIQFLLLHGSVGGRRAAAQAIAEFTGPEVSQVVLAAIDDQDPQVQANLLVQLRERGIPGAMTKLLELADSPHLIVRQAVQHCLAEFSFKRYLAAFDMLSPSVRISTGALVRKIDLETPAQIAVELQAPSRQRKQRALEIVACLGIATEVEPQLIELLADDEPSIRLDATQLLASCDSAETRQALRMAMLDRHAEVKSSAERALRSVTETTEFKPRSLLPGTGGRST